MIDPKRRAALLDELSLIACRVFESNKRHGDGSSVVTHGLDRMMRIILEVRPRRLNDYERGRFVEHLKASVYEGAEPELELGGKGRRNMLLVNGVFNLEELAKRMIWTHDMSGQILDLGVSDDGRREDQESEDAA